MDGTVRTFRFLFVGKRNMGILYLRGIMQWILVRHRLSGAINFEWKLADVIYRIMQMSRCIIL